MKLADLSPLTALFIMILAALGITLAGSQGGISALGMPIFALAILMVFVIQWVGFTAAYLLQTDKFFDLVGSITFISVTAMAVWRSPVVDGRTILLLMLVVIWAGRLGTFLFRRIQKAGKDARFDDIKVSFVRFLNTWTLQGLWVTMTLSVTLAAITTTNHKEIDLFAIAGTLIWIFGFAIEVTADSQKARYFDHQENEGKFIDTGLWSWSRHPNYFGEIVLWVGVAIIAMPVLQGWQWVTLISPVFVTLLLTRISGLPILEKRADERWGGQKDYEAYKRRTPVLIPWPPKSGSKKSG
jgi:steroid 5-alpha reductase family enzyme